MSATKLLEEDMYANKEGLEPFLSCLDHTVSRETFDLFLDRETDLLVTFPRPSESELPGYYESEDYISHTDSKKSLMDRVYQMVKNYSIKKKLKLMNSLSGGGGKLLDIGCGTGDLLSACEKDGWEIKGVEPNERARELALGKVVSQESVLSDINDISSDLNHTFNVISMWHVLEHVPNLSEYIVRLKQLLTSDGYLIIAVPNFKSYDANHYKEFWAAYDVPRHLWHFSEKSIRHIFAVHDFKVVDTRPLIFDAFYVSLLSEKYKSGKSNLLSALKIGLRSNLKARSSKQYSSMIYVIKNT